MQGPYTGDNMSKLQPHTACKPLLGLGVNINLMRAALSKIYHGKCPIYTLKKSWSGESRVLIKIKKKRGIEDISVLTALSPYL
jgi:hypothetical protein